MPALRYVIRPAGAGRRLHRRRRGSGRPDRGRRGRLARIEAVSGAIRRRLEPFAPTRVLEGFAAVAKQAAQGAALVADGLAGGAHRELVELLAIREARGSVLDHLYVVPREQALRRLGGGAELS